MQLILTEKEYLGVVLTCIQFVTHCEFLWTSEDVDIQYQTSVFNLLKYSGYYVHHVM